MLINIVRVSDIYLTYCLSIYHQRKEEQSLVIADSFKALLKILWSKTDDFSGYSAFEQEIVGRLKNEEQYFNITLILIIISFLQIGKESPLTSVK